MIEARIGRDLCIKCRISNLQEIGYENLSMILTDSRMNYIKIAEINVTDGNVITGYFWGKDLRVLGEYTVTLWRNYGLKGQTCIDRIRAFRLCKVAPPVNEICLQESPLYVGIQGESAYQSWLNLGNKGSEEDFINSLKADFNIDDADKDKLGELIAEVSESRFSVIESDIESLRNDFNNIEIPEVDLSEYIKGEVLSEEDYSNLTEIDSDKVYLITGDNNVVGGSGESYDDTEIRQLISDLDNKIDNIDIPDVDLSGYYNKVETDELIQNSKSKIIDSNEFSFNFSGEVSTAIDAANKGIIYKSATVYYNYDITKLNVGDIIQAGTNQILLIGIYKNIYTFLPNQYTHKMPCNYIVITFDVKNKSCRISVNDSFIQPKLTAGDNITIENNVISATVPDIDENVIKGIAQEVTDKAIDAKRTEAVPEQFIVYQSNPDLFDNVTDLNSFVYTYLTNKDDLVLSTVNNETLTINFDYPITFDYIYVATYLSPNQLNCQLNNTNITQSDVAQITAFSGSGSTAQGIYKVTNKNPEIPYNTVTFKLGGIGAMGPKFLKFNGTDFLVLFETEGKPATYSDKFTKLDVQITVINSSISSVNSLVSTLKSDVSTLKTDVSTLKSDVDLTNEAIMDFGMKIFEIEDDVDTLKTTDTQIKNRLTVLENKVDNDTIYDDTELREMIIILQNKVAELESGNIGDTRVGVEITALPNTTYDVHKFTGISNSNITTDNKGIGFIEIDKLPENCWYLTSNVKDNLIKFKLVNIKTSNVTNMSDMFNKCSQLTEFNTTGFVTNNVTNMLNMFYSCSSLTELDLSNFATGKVTNMEMMFTGCSSLTELKVSTWNISNVTTMRMMFLSCSSLTELDLTNWNVSKVTDMYGIFSMCSQLTSIKCTQATYNKFVENGVWPSGCQHILPD